MFCYHHKSDDAISDGIVFRVRPNNYEQLDQKGAFKDKEMITMQLAYVAGVAQEVLAIFKNGLAYRYAQGRTMELADLSKPHVIKYVKKHL